MMVHNQISRVTERMIERSRASREVYLSRLDTQIQEKPNRSALGCGNLAHGFAACGPDDKAALSGDILPNLGIITAYNDMLSAHQPYKNYPDLIKQTAREAGGVAQIAAGVPAMCDGVTQGFPGMELSLFSRDLIAMSASIGLTHNMFDGVLFLGICDKIVPGLVIAALTFGHLPAIFVPAGPMPTGLPNQEKAKIRQLYAEGKIGREELLKGESQSYHAPGTCTFYGTANTNQMLMEFMGLHLPGSSFINPGTELRDALTREATRRALSITALGDEFTPVGKMIDERSFVNAIIGLHATGGSTNLTLHLIAMARAGGIHLTLEDIADLSEVIPLLARVYPNGMADVNHFHAAGGLPFLIGELLDNGLLHEDVNTIVGEGLSRYCFEPKLGANGEAIWEKAAEKPGNEKILARVDAPFAKSGGLKILSGNLGQAVSKVSAVEVKRHVVEAPAIVFHDQHEIVDAFQAGELDRDFIAVLRFQGPKANGMPELHKMVPPLGVLQDKGFKVALVTDGRMSGASGKIPSAIHVTPEAAEGGNIGKIESGDIIRIDVNAGTLELLVDANVIAGRTAANPDLSGNEFGLGRELFAAFRANVSGADMGASVI
ncbi:MAG: phosphogluconate dehydratase [Hyphomicrobiales bacterium]|nr:MAG: phosphogluconate dehydratase [Hyphomicrobiales bacterium]